LILFRLLFIVEEKKMKKKFLVALMTFVLIIGLVGCGSSRSSSSASIMLKLMLKNTALFRLN